jgi:hypothetical protein
MCMGVGFSLIDIHSECRLLCVQHWSTTTNCYLWIVGPCLPLQDLPFLHHVACVQVACSRVPAIEGEAHPMTKEDSPKDATSWSHLVHQSLITFWGLAQWTVEPVQRNPQSCPNCTIIGRLGDTWNNRKCVEDNRLHLSLNKRCSDLELPPPSNEVSMI